MRATFNTASLQTSQFGSSTRKQSENVVVRMSQNFRRFFLHLSLRCPHRVLWSEPWSLRLRKLQILPDSSYFHPLVWLWRGKGCLADSHVLGDGSTTSAAALDRIHRNICGNNCRKLMWKIVEPCTSDSFEFSWNPHPFAWSFGFVLGPGQVIPFEFQAFCGKRTASASRVSTFLWGTLIPACTCARVCTRPEFQNHLLYACFARFMRFLPTLPAKNINNQFSFMTFLVVREFLKLVWVSEGVFRKCFENVSKTNSGMESLENSQSFPCVCQAPARSGVILMAKTIPKFPIAVRRCHTMSLQIVTTLKNK